MKVSRWKVIYGILGNIITSLGVKLLLPFPIIGFFLTFREIIEGKININNIFNRNYPFCWCIMGEMLSVRYYLDECAGNIFVTSF